MPASGRALGCSYLDRFICEADGKDPKMPKDTKKMAAARGRSRMGRKKAKAEAKVSAVARAVSDKVSKRQTKRRKLKQKGKTGR